MQIHAQAQAGQLAQGAPAGLPPGLLAGHPGAPPAGLPTTMSLLAGIPTSLSQAGPHPAFASLLAQQKPAADPMAAAKAREDELKRPAPDTNGGKFDHSSFMHPSTQTLHIPGPPPHGIIPPALQNDSERQVRE